MGLQSGVSRWPFVGRAEQLDEFGRAWHDRRCRGLVIYGPAGVGKTRLAEECMTTVVHNGEKIGRVTVTATAAAVPLGAVAHLIPAGVDLSNPVEGFAAVARVLAGPQGTRQWVVLVDDLHLLDAASAVLLRHLIDAGVMRLIATVRSGEAVSDAVEALTDCDQTQRIDLMGLDSEQLEAMVRAVLGGPVGRRTLHELHTASGGNPLYLRELVLGSLQSGTLASDGEIWELEKGALTTTPELRELVGARLAAAAPASVPALELLALCEPVPLVDAQAVASLDLLVDLESAGLISVITDWRRVSLTLAHPLYGEVLRANLPAARRRQLLLAQADRVKQHGQHRRDDAMHLATWQLAATGTADPALLLQAAALARYAHDYQQVITLIQDLPDDQRTYTSCLLHGEALTQLGEQWQQADVLLAEAETRADGGAQRVTATLARTWNLFWLGAQTEDALAVNDAACTQTNEALSRHLLKVNEAAMRTLSGQPTEGLALLHELETNAEDAPDANVWAGAAVCKTTALDCAGRIAEAIAWGEHAYASHMRVTEQKAGPHPVSQLNPLVFALADAGQLARARETADRVLADAADAPITFAWGAFFRGRVEWMAGDALAARRWYADAVAQARARGVARMLFHAWAGLAASAAVLGDLEGAEAALTQMRACPPMGVFAGEEDLGQAWLLAARGNLGQAREVLIDAAGRARKTGHVPSEVLLLTDIARLGGAKDVAGRLNDLTSVCDGAFALARAQLAAALAADDPQQLQAAAEGLEAIGAYLLAAEAASAAATAWRRVDNTRRATAATNQSHAHAAFCPGVSTPLLSASEGSAALTRREREIAVLAAKGAPSRDIAGTLHLSVRTVDNHLHRVYGKMGVTNRQELAVVLATTGRPMTAARPSR